MRGLFNIHTVFGSLSPKQSKQEERKEQFVSSLWSPFLPFEPEVSGCHLFFTCRWWCHFPDKCLLQRGVLGWCWLSCLKTAHISTLQTALINIRVTLDLVAV